MTLRRQLGLAGAVAVLAAGCLTAGCFDNLPRDADDWPVEVGTVAEIEHFAERSALVSLSGRVEAQADERLLLADPTGLVWVRLTDSLPELEGHRVSLVGAVQRRRDTLRVDALLWAYDPLLDEEATPGDDSAGQ